jgi:acetolactate synthase-1/2/3 large subunit
MGWFKVRVARDLGGNMLTGALTGGMVVSRTLSRYGSRTVFSLAGASHTHLLDALDRDGFTIIGGRHETGTIGAADGYARITGRLGIALVIADQGMPNAIMGLATAFHAASPVLVLVARLPDSWTEADAETDNLKLELAAPVVKWSRTVPSPERLAEYVDVACRRALSGRPGPVLLQLPQEFMAAAVKDPGAAVLPPPVISRPEPDPQHVRQAAELIAAAERPLVICGAGATRGRAGPGLKRLHQEFDLVIAGNGLGRGLVPEDWERSFNWPMAQIAARHADVVLVVGARLKQRLGYGLPPRFSAAAKFIQVDVEAEELGRNRRIDVPVVADAGRFCGRLADALAEMGYKGPPKRVWLREALHERIKYLLAIASADSDPIHPLRLGRAIMERLAPDDIVVGDGADVQNWMYGALRIRRAPGFLDHYPLGGMGIGTPLAVGAAAAARELAAAGDIPRRVVLVTGDGSIGFYPAELHAAAMAGLPLVTVVCNDGAWGTELHGQRKAIGRAVNTELGCLPYERLGEAFGGQGFRVERTTELGPALDAAFACTVPSIVNVLVDREAGAALKTDPRAALIMFDDLATGLGTQHAFGSSQQ